MPRETIRQPCECMGSKKGRQEIAISSRISDDGFVFVSYTVRSVQFRPLLTFGGHVRRKRHDTHTPDMTPQG